jgi:hypothetical protein
LDGGAATAAAAGQSGSLLGQVELRTSQSGAIPVQKVEMSEDHDKKA